MGKKRQPDFQKVQLRVGRSVPKRRNVSDSSFSSRKIVLRQTIHSTHATENIEEFFRCLNHNQSATLAKLLKENRIGIRVNREKILMNHMKGLHRIMDLVRDFNHEVRINAITFLTDILCDTPDAKLSGIFLYLTTALSCAMTHPNFEIRQDSLLLFDAILMTHPDMLTNYNIFLDELLGMILRTTSSMDTRKRKRTLDDCISDDIRASDWRMSVLNRMSAFLEIVLKRLTKEENDDDEQEVCWDGKKPLYVPIYAGSGLKPIDIEKPDTELSNCYRKPEVLKTFVSELIPAISSILTEEIMQFQKASSKESLPSISHLRTLLNILCYLGNWIKATPEASKEFEDWFSNMYYSYISSTLMKNFPLGPKLEESSGRFKTSKKRNQASSIEINLRICHLYTLFLLGTQFSVTCMEDRISKYLKDVFKMKYEDCFPHIPLLLQITKNCLSDVDDEDNRSLLKELCNKLSFEHNDSSQKELEAFFMELSLNIEYRNLANTAEMKSWYKYMLSHLKEFLERNSMNIRLLKNIKKIACRKYPGFIDCLQNVQPKEFIKLLKHDNENLQDTVVQLIYCRKYLSPDFQQDIAEAILLTPSFSFKTASQMIRLLSHRFSQSNVSMDQILCIKFVLNIACDTACIGDTPQHCERILMYMLEKWEVLRSFCKYEILPSAAWEKHSRLYKVCMEALRLFSEPRKSLCIKSFLETVIPKPVRIPVHSAIAILKLKADFSTSSYISQNETIKKVTRELIFSCLFYTSSLSTYGAEWEKYCIPESFRILDLNRKTVFNVLRQMKKVATSFNADAAYFAMKICGFFILHKLLIPDDKMEIIPLLEILEAFSNEDVEFREYFLRICHYFRCFLEH